MSAAWIDVSAPIDGRLPHWPGDPPPEIERVAEIARGDEAEISIVRMSAHTGTHVDAPSHYLERGSTLDAVPFDALIGPAQVIEIAHERDIGPAELEASEIERGARVLFRTKNSKRVWIDQPFTEDFVALSVEGAEWLAARGVQCVGVDYLSVGHNDESGPKVHRALLSAGIWIIEGLDLRGVSAGRYELLCLPLRLRGAEGGPARALLRALD